jgi:glutathione S-transferase
MGMEIYVFPPSPRAIKVMAVANHLGLDWTMRALDFSKGDHKTPAYAALNPNCRMPTLKDGDYVMWEANAIMQHLASKKPSGGLFPPDDKARLDITRWQFWDLAHWDPVYAVFLFEYLVKPRLMGINEPDTAALAKAAELFHRSAQVLDGHLKGRKYVSGDALTVADFSLGAGLIYADAARLPVEPYGEIKRWYAALNALPAWRNTIEQNMLRPAAAAA